MFDTVDDHGASTSQAYRDFIGCVIVHRRGKARRQCTDSDRETSRRPVFG
jgi:hypothetical protein